MDRQNRWSLVDRKLFLGQNRLLTSIMELRRRDPSLNQGHSLLAFVFVRAFEVINSNELPQRVSETVHTENIDAEVKNAV
jgi:hypothetical protein